MFMGTETSTMTAKLAFFPPNPPTYTVVTDESTGKIDEDIGGHDSSRGNEIVGLYVKNPTAKLTGVYSHGNAADLGYMFIIFIELIKSPSQCQFHGELDKGYKRCILFTVECIHRLYNSFWLTDNTYHPGRRCRLASGDSRNLFHLFLYLSLLVEAQDSRTFCA
ncbi:hypothetical protein HID58_036564 [Brassica napus]|uniref:Uncharacterized protein n=1 Tax=Brassica napus TaxID=3708 RepID=A0ABQ8C877_BRANA|nr:hypothetical protein HID58_036564 [Brassica napus]